jgi:hypothetical protein
MNNGPVERKWPYQPPELAREITIRQSRACIYAALPYPVMGATVSRRKVVLGRKLWCGNPTLNGSQAGSTLFAGHDDILRPDA